MVDPPGLDIIFHILSKLRHSAQRSVEIFQRRRGDVVEFVSGHSWWGTLEDVARLSKRLCQIVQITTNMYKMPIVSKTNNQAKIVVLAKKKQRSGAIQLFSSTFCSKMCCECHKLCQRSSDPSELIFTISSFTNTKVHFCDHVEILTFLTGQSNFLAYLQ